MIDGSNLLDIIDSINESIDAYQPNGNDKANKLDHECICTFCDHDRDKCGKMWCFKASELKEIFGKIYRAWWSADDCDTCRMHFTEHCNKDNCERK